MTTPANEGNRIFNKMDFARFNAALIAGLNKLKIGSITVGGSNEIILNKREGGSAAEGIERAFFKLIRKTLETRLFDEGFQYVDLTPVELYRQLSEASRIEPREHQMRKAISDFTSALIKNEVTTGEKTGEQIARRIIGKVQEAINAALGATVSGPQ